MSSIMSKQLGEFLQEQQEPFILEVYLLERGYSCRRPRFISSDHDHYVSSGYGSSSSTGGNNIGGTLLKRSVSSGLKRNSRTFIPNCSRFVRGLFTKLLSSNVADDDGHRKINNISGSCREKKYFCNNNIPSSSEIGSSSSTTCKETADQDDEYSSASSATIFNSCSDSDVEDAYNDDYYSRRDAMLLTEVAGWKNINKDSSPVSVLEHTEANDASPLYKKNNNDVRRRQFHHFSALLCAYKSETKKQLRRCDASSQYSRNKRAAQQTKQLVFDCVREVVEGIKKKEYSSDHPSPQMIILGPDELWELICDNISLWSKEPINETNTSHLVRFDVIASAQEWSSKFEQQREELGMQIADAILEDIIRNEIIRDLTTTLP